MIVNGEKWACESCVRGHRVSNCNHFERTLQHINKKGRPVSQCPHCRSLRRSKSAHHKCDCGEKVTKCPHLQTSVEGHRDTCCCNHGAPCTCARKKDPPQLDTVLESDSDHGASSSTSSKVSKTARKRRSRTSTQNADGILSFDEHGHHKPTYKHVKPHQKVGPYPLRPGHSNQSASSMEDLGNEMPIPMSKEQRLAKSETTSPLMTAASSISQSLSSLPPLDTSAAQNFGPSEYTMFDGDMEPPMMSASLNGPEVTWANYGPVLKYQERTASYAPSSFSQTTSFFEHPSALPSGEVSEAEDLGLSTADDLDFDPIGTFSRTNTASTGFSFDLPGDSVAGDAGMDSTELDFAKLVNKELDSYNLGAAAAAAAPFIADVSAANEESFIADLYWPTQARDGEPDFNDTNFWP